MHIYILPQCSTTAASVLNSAGMDAQFERSCCAISRGILIPVIRIELDVMLARRKMTLTELSRRLDIALPNLSILKNGHAKAIRMALLDALCRELDCQPGELLVWEPDDAAEKE